MLILTQLWANKYFRYGSIGIVVLAIVYLVGKSAGKKKNSLVKLPNNGSQIPAGWSPANLANELYSKLSGVFTWAADKEVTLGKAFDLTDDQLVAVYNYFNQNFSGSNGTLTKWLRDEFNVTVGGVRDSLVARLVKLNCL